MHAENLLKRAGVPVKLIPIPRHLSSDCGVCLRFARESRATVEETLRDRVGYDRIVDTE
ncbi:MAG: DUF3343 domain-containing protein [Spirochaetes bacterium]|nr:MAG: DUF3343 domain-containing protein [Spirochaetota bacterium]